MQRVIFSTKWHYEKALETRCWHSMGAFRPPDNGRNKSDRVPFA